MANTTVEKAPAWRCSAFLKSRAVHGGVSKALQEVPGTERQGAVVKGANDFGHALNVLLERLTG